jgi:hypothetical protein
MERAALYRAVSLAETAGLRGIGHRLGSMLKCVDAIQEPYPLVPYFLAREELWRAAVVLEPDELAAHILEIGIVAEEALRHQHQLNAIL